MIALMWERFAKYYVAFPYEDPAFTCDEVGQQRMHTAALRKDRRLLRAFVLMMGAFVLLFCMAVLHQWYVAVAGVIVFVAAWGYGLVYHLMGRPRLRCVQCHQIMEIRYAPIPDDRVGRYLVCPKCRTYVFTYLSSR